MKSKNIIESARTILSMNRDVFGVWLAEQVGSATSIPASKVFELESGKQSPEKNIRDACLSIVAGEIASDAVLGVCSAFRGSGADVMGVAMSPGMKDLKEQIKNRIINAMI